MGRSHIWVSWSLLKCMLCSRSMQNTCCSTHHTMDSTFVPTLTQLQLRANPEDGNTHTLWSKATSAQKRISSAMLASPKGKHDLSGCWTKLVTWTWPAVANIKLHGLIPHTECPQLLEQLLFFNTLAQPSQWSSHYIQVCKLCLRHMGAYDHLWPCGCSGSCLIHLIEDWFHSSHLHQLLLLHNSRAQSIPNLQTGWVLMRFALFLTEWNNCLWCVCVPEWRTSLITRPGIMWVAITKDKRILCTQLGWQLS